MSREPIKFFLCGPPKSGTTWLQLMLDAHPEVICAGEGHLTDWIIAPLRKLLTEYNQQLQTNNDLIYREKATHTGFSEGDFKDLTRFIIDRRFAKLAERNPDAVVVGDKTPNYAYALELLSAIFPTSRFVYLVRDPRDSVLSIFHQTRRLEEKHRRIYDKDEEIFRGYLKKWVDVNRLYIRHREKYPNQTIHLRYEDLLTDENKALCSIFEFLGVSTDPSAVSACAAAARFNALSGGRERGQQDNKSFFRRGEAGAWRSEFDGRIEDFITPEVAALMVELGYEQQAG